MELLPKELADQLPPLYSQEHVEDPTVMMKFFHPLSPWTWYAIEYSPEAKLFFGYVHSDQSELGYFSLSEMEDIADSLGLPMERDLSFKPMKLSEVKHLHPELPAILLTPPQPIIVFFLDDEEEEEQNGSH